jgi:hypothetical protein
MRLSLSYEIDKRELLIASLDELRVDQIGNLSRPEVFRTASVRAEGQNRRAGSRDD